jgi:nucleotide-binding universal stress UspA family protein
MERHLLVTVSEQSSALYGIRFVGHIFSNKEGMKLTLFYTAPRPGAVWEGERSPDRVKQSEQQAKQYEAKGRKALEEARKVLTKLGFKQEQLGIKFRVRQRSKVMDIIQEGERGLLYDAVVLGRRGLSWLEEAFEDSVSKGLLEKRCDFPIWICRRPDLERKNVLLCLDGSEASYRMAEHVGFILAEEENQEVTFFTVKKPGAKVKESPDSILSKSKELLLSIGFPAEMAKTKVVVSGNVAKAILKEAEQGRYAAVAVGRTGAGDGVLKRIFMGSVSDTLFRDLEKAALWTCQ